MWVSSANRTDSSFKNLSRTQALLSDSFKSSISNLDANHRLPKLSAASPLPTASFQCAHHRHPITRPDPAPGNSGSSPLQAGNGSPNRCHETLRTKPPMDSRAAFRSLLLSLQPSSLLIDIRLVAVQCPPIPPSALSKCHLPSRAPLTILLKITTSTGPGHAATIRAYHEDFVSLRTGPRSHRLGVGWCCSTQLQWHSVNTADAQYPWGFAPGLSNTQIRWCSWHLDKMVRFGIYASSCVLYFLLVHIFY